MQRKLKIKLLVIQLLSILPFLIFIFYLFDLWYDSRRSSVLDDNIDQATTIVEFLNKSLDVATTVGKVMATNINVETILAKDENGLNGALRNINLIKPEFLTISILDRNGNFIAHSADLTPEEKLINYADRDYFQETLRTKKTFISNPVLGRVTKQSVVAITVPVFKDEEIVAVVRISYSLDYLKGEIEKTIAESAYKTIFVLDRNNNIIILTNKPLLSEEEKSLFRDFDFIKTTRQNKRAYIENLTLPIINKPSIGASMLASEFGWVVVSVVPVSEIFAPIWKSQSAIWIIMLFAFLFSFSLLTYFLRKVKIVY